MMKYAKLFLCSILSCVWTLHGFEKTPEEYIAINNASFKNVAVQYDIAQRISQEFSPKVQNYTYEQLDTWIRQQAVRYAISPVMIALLLKSDKQGTQITTGLLSEGEATSAPILSLSQRWLAEHKGRVLQFIKQQLNNAEGQTPIDGNDIMPYIILSLLIPAAQINPQLLSTITVTSQEGKDMLQLLQNIL